MGFLYLPCVKAATVHFAEPHFDVPSVRVAFTGLWVHLGPEERRQLRAYERRFDRALARSRRNGVGRRRRHGRQR